MKERPILFSAPMVRALLDGSKTQTRRIVKPQPYGVDPLADERVRRQFSTLCPYGKLGDQLWVRETFQPLFAEGWQHGVGDRVPDFETGEGYKIGYPATDGAVEWIDGDDNITSRSKPSIHMPRWASRIQLEIVSVRVQRLQDISEADARAEGIVMSKGVPLFIQPGATTLHTNARSAYRDLWDSINGAGSWAANSWIWAVEFRRLP